MKTLALTLACLCITLNSPAATAVSASNFLNSIGACTHITQGADDPSQVATCLTYAGIRNIRDDGTTNPSTLQSFVNLYNSSGAKVCILPITGNIANSLYEDETLAAGGALLAVEGPNEPNNTSVNYDGVTSSYAGGNFLPVAEFQRDLYSAVKADAKLEGIPVFASSEAGGSEPDNVGLQFLTIPSGAGCLLPEGTVYADYANTHNYICAHLSSVVNNNAWNAEDPALNSSWDGPFVEYGLTWHKGFSGYSDTQLETLPKVTTETGWATQGSNAITQDQQGKLFLNLYLSAFARGWKYTFVYMLKDDSSQGYWGFFGTSYAPKLSATYLHNFTTILADTALMSSPGVLNYSIPNEPTTVHDLLIQKSTGVYELAVWDENASGSDSVNVNLGSMYASINVYDPTAGTTPVQTLANSSTVSLTLSDHPMIIEIVASPVTPPVSLPSVAVASQNSSSGGSFTFSTGSPVASPLSVAYSVGGTAVPGSDYTSLSGMAVIPAGSSSVTVPVATLPNFTGGSTVVATIGQSVSYTLGSATSATVVLPADSPPPVVPPASGFTDADIGNPGKPGSAVAGSSTITASGGGSNIWYTSDQFNFYSAPMTGDNILTVHVDSQQNTSVGAKAGLMFRNMNSAKSSFVAVYQNPNGLVEMQWRDASGGEAAWAGSTVAKAGTLKWLELVKSGDSFTSYYATTKTVPGDSDWIKIGTHATDFVGSAYLGGLAVTADNNRLLETAVFSGFSYEGDPATPPATPTPPAATPAYSDLDIGSPGLAGSAAQSSTITIAGGGSDIWYTSDQFNYWYQTNTTDKTIIAHVDSIQNTNSWAKSGLMFRNSAIAGAAFVAVYENPANLVEMQWRDSDGAQAAWLGNQMTSPSSANWLELVKTGSTFSAYYATTTSVPAATDWILIATHTSTFTNPTYLGGLAVTAHNNGLLNTSVFSGFSQ